jgi:hypothetical protein
VVLRHSLDWAAEAVGWKLAVGLVMEGVPWNGSRDCAWPPLVVQFVVVGVCMVVSVQEFGRKD